MPIEPNTLRARILDACKTSAKTSEQIALDLGETPMRIQRAIGNMVSDGLLARANPGERPALFGLAATTAPRYDATALIAAWRAQP